MIDPDSTLFDDQTRHIATIGWAVTAVIPTQPDDGPPFAYTVGLTAHEPPQPEFVIAGLHPLISHALLNDMAGRIDTCGHLFHHGQTITDLIDGYDATLIDGPPSHPLWPATAIARYGSDIRLRQIVWPDPDHHYPWDSGYCYPADVQPLIGHL